MKSLNSLIDSSWVAQISKEEIHWLHLLIADWQVLADLSGSDLVLWLPAQGDAEAKDAGSEAGTTLATYAPDAPAEVDDFVAIALCRSATASTVHMEDIIGLHAAPGRVEELREAMRTKSVQHPMGVHWAGSYSVSLSYVPVVYRGRAIAVISRETNYASPGLSASKDKWESRAVDTLCEMITRGEYPYETADSAGGRGAPRVVDGVIMLDAAGRVEHITPNANSALRRLGVSSDLAGKNLLSELVSAFRDRHRLDEAFTNVVMGRASWRVEVEANGSTVVFRALVLLEQGERSGAILLCRDVTETRRREQELITKDATIREIHHRVKNNLQTVSSLLRMQARQATLTETKEALREAGRRVETIATVHEALSQNVDEEVAFDEVVGTILRLAANVATTQRNVTVHVSGHFGVLSADEASALATVLAELVTNAASHGLGDEGGNIWVDSQRDGDQVVITVADDGVGMDLSNLKRGLGTRIVEMMVKGDLHGTVTWSQRAEGGTVATIDMRVGFEFED